MLVAMSKNDVPIRLPEERWQHVVSRHPEMWEHQEEVLDTVEEPDFIQEGDFGVSLAARFYSRTALTSKYVMVAYRELGEEDGFVLTAYLTNGPTLRRRVIWER